jgi:hypothetical protein
MVRNPYVVRYGTVRYGTVPLYKRKVVSQSYRICIRYGTVPYRTCTNVPYSKVFKGSNYKENDQVGPHRSTGSPVPSTVL